MALYWSGISINAARAKAASFFDICVCSDIIFVKFTNCEEEGMKSLQLLTDNVINKYQGEYDQRNVIGEA